jgi:phosphoribosylformylglycinamidine cyclo-ligase
MRYADAGVDIKEEEKAVRALTSVVKYVRRGIGEPVLTGHYASAVTLLPICDLLVTITTDGVGSKILVAEKMNRFDTVGIDCVAMNVNDLIAVGSEPVAMVDYIAIEKPNKEIMAEIAKGLEEGCKIANITLVGGETATLPDIVRGFDLAGTAIGIAKKDSIITGEKIQPGDVIFGIPSSGIHSNGLTLVRKVLENAGIEYGEEFSRGVSYGEEILKPTRIYVDVLNVLKDFEVKGMVHITGGGLLNFLRLKKLKYLIDNPLKPQKIFRVIQELGNVEEDEMYRTFNMGMGFALVMDKYEGKKLEKSGFLDGRIVGRVEEGEGVYVKDLKISRNL